MSDVHQQTDLVDYFRLRDRVTLAADRLFARYADELQCRRGCYYCCDPITVLPVEIEAVRRYLLREGIPAQSRLGGPVEDRGETPQAILERDARPSAPANPERRSVDRSTDGVFPPVHLDSIDRRGHTVAPDLTTTKRCAFLGRAGECTIYEARPLICRTHGLPLAYRVYEYDIHGREVRPDIPDYVDLWCDLNFRSLSDESAPDYFDANGRINMDEINRELELLDTAFAATQADRRYSGPSDGADRLPLGVLLEPGQVTRRRRPRSGEL